MFERSNLPIWYCVNMYTCMVMIHAFQKFDGVGGFDDTIEHLLEAIQCFKYTTKAFNWLQEIFSHMCGCRKRKKSVGDNLAQSFQLKTEFRRIRSTSLDHPRDLISIYRAALTICHCDNIATTRNIRIYFLAKYMCHIKCFKWIIR